MTRKPDSSFRISHLAACASLVAQMVKIHLQWGIPWFYPWFGKFPWRRALATHSSVLAWRIPWAEEPGGLQSRGSQRVGHDWAAEHTPPCLLPIPLYASASISAKRKFVLHNLWCLFLFRNNYTSMILIM